MEELVLLITTEDGIIAVEITLGIGEDLVKGPILRTISCDELFRLSLLVKVRIVGYADNTVISFTGNRCSVGFGWYDSY